MVEQVDSLIEDLRWVLVRPESEYEEEPDAEYLDGDASLPDAVGRARAMLADNIGWPFVRLYRGAPGAPPLEQVPEFDDLPDQDGLSRSGPGEVVVRRTSAPIGGLTRVTISGTGGLVVAITQYVRYIGADGGDVLRVNIGVPGGPWRIVDTRVRLTSSNTLVVAVTRPCKEIGLKAKDMAMVTVQWPSRRDCVKNPGARAPGKPFTSSQRGRAPASPGRNRPCRGRAPAPRG